VPGVIARAGSSTPLRRGLGAPPKREGDPGRLAGDAMAAPRTVVQPAMAAALVPAAERLPAAPDLSGPLARPAGYARAARADTPPRVPGSAGGGPAGAEPHPQSANTNAKSTLPEAPPAQAMAAATGSGTQRSGGRAAHGRRHPPHSMLGLSQDRRLGALPAPACSVPGAVREGVAGT
jgi:hypothetical protein